MHRENKVSYVDENLLSEKQKKKIEDEQVVELMVDGAFRRIWQKGYMSYASLIFILALVSY